MNETLKYTIITILYLLVIALGFLLYFLHKRRIRKHNEKRMQNTENFFNIVSRFDVPKPIDEVLETILIACYVAFTILAMIFSNKYSYIGVGILFLCAIFLNSVTEKKAKKDGYNEGYDKGYTDSYHETRRSTTLAIAKQILLSFDTETPENKTAVCKIINDVKNSAKFSKSDVKSLLNVVNLKYIDFYKYLKDKQYFYIQNEE